ncbi:MAG: hypothetical protein ABEJ07_00850 [Candidatus Nanohaloarchaea archaeon]
MRKGLLSVAIVLFLSSVTAQATGAFLHNGSLEVEDFSGLVEVQQGDRTEFNWTNGTVKIFDRDEGLNMPTGYILLILAFLLVVIYSVDIDPFWIAILLFMVAFTAVVYYLKWPKYVIPLMLILVTVVKHYR